MNFDVLPQSLAPWQWIVGAASAIIIGFSKTAFPVRHSCGAHDGDGIWRSAIGWRNPTDVDPGRLLCGWVLSGPRRMEPPEEARTLCSDWLAIGFFALYVLGVNKPQRDLVSPIIGGIVLAMIGLSLLRGRLGNRLVPTSTEGVAATGILAGFTTMVSNAAGPIMQIYMLSTGMEKRELMGTNAWYFFIFNISKIPLLLAITLLLPAEPVISWETAAFNGVMFPLIILGALAGRSLLPHIPQKTFNALILALTFVAAVRLLFA